MSKSLYIHIPFCSRKCLYCDFYSRAYDRALAEAYIGVLCKQLKSLSGDFSTFYIGGGTPSVLNMASLKKLLGSLKPISKAASEFTIEVNPETIDKNRLKLFLDGGVNRISIGVQSFFDPKLKVLGRVHSAAQAIAAIRMAKKAGFKDVGIDLIFGTSQENLSDWMAELKAAVRMDIAHISTYCLTYEKNTPLFLQVKRKLLIPLDSGMLARMYQGAVDYLSQRGFRHYEISNFAKPGFESKHNSNYWQGEPYLGLGPSAVSFINNRREKNICEVGEYIKRIDRRQSPVIFSESLSKLRRAKELAAIKIRTKEGIDFKWFRTRTGYDFLKLESESLEELSRDGLFKYRKRKGRITGIYLTRKGFCFADSVSSALV